MNDFTIAIYLELLSALHKEGYSFQTCEQFINNPLNKVVILRHDIDIKKKKALLVAELEKTLGIKATYYFRTVKASYDPEIIKKVAALGHEIGYHYEDLAAADGNFDKAIKSFENNLKLFRFLYPIKTICMHGSSRSKFDNRLLWQKFDYRDYGIICEPYLDLDFDEVFYLTDTGQAWNGNRVSLRDKVESKYTISFETTFDILNNIDQLPNRIMITMHPDRWAANMVEGWYIKCFVFLHNNFKKYFLKYYLMLTNRKEK